MRTLARPVNHHASPTVAAASAALIPVSHWSAIRRPGDRDERHQGDRRERRERHEDVAVLEDHVLGAEADVEPGPAVEEGVGEVEEVAAHRRRSTGWRASRRGPAAIVRRMPIQAAVSRRSRSGAGLTSTGSRVRRPSPAASATPVGSAPERRPSRGRLPPVASRDGALPQPDGEHAEEGDPEQQRVDDGRQGRRRGSTAEVTSGISTAHHWRRSSSQATGRSRSIA